MQSHTDHKLHESDRFHAAATALHLGMTGGSDFHGDPESDTRLNSLALPLCLLEALRH